MAPLTIDNRSDQETLRQNTRGDALYAPYDYGKIRCYHFRFKNETGGTIAADSIIALGLVPQGLILPTSKIICTDLGTGVTLDIGFDEYKKNDGVLVAADTDELVDGTDVATAAINSELHEIGTAAVQNSGYVLDGQALLVCSPKGSTWAANGELNVYLYHVNGQ